MHARCVMAVYVNERYCKWLESNDCVLHSTCSQTVHVHVHVHVHHVMYMYLVHDMYMLSIIRKVVVPNPSDCFPNGCICNMYSTRQKKVTILLKLIAI